MDGVYTDINRVIEECEAHAIAQHGGDCEATSDWMDEGDGMRLGVMLTKETDQMFAEAEEYDIDADPNDATKYVWSWVPF